MTEETPKIDPLLTTTLKPVVTDDDHDVITPPRKLPPEAAEKPDEPKQFDLEAVPEIAVILQRAKDRLEKSRKAKGYKEIFTNLRSTGQFQIPEIVDKLIEYSREFRPDSFLSRNYDILRLTEQFLEYKKDIYSWMHAEIPLLSEIGGESTFLLLSVIEKFRGLTNPDRVKERFGRFWPKKQSRSGKHYSDLSHLKKEENVADHTMTGDSGAFPFSGELTEQGKEVLQNAEPIAFGTRLLFQELRESIMLSEHADEHPELGMTLMSLNPTDRLPSTMGKEHKDVAPVFVIFKFPQKKIKIEVPARYFYINNLGGFAHHIKAAMDNPNNWRANTHDKETTTNAFRGKVSPYQQELNRRDPNNYDAADACVVFGEEESTDINVLKNHPDFLTTPGTPLMYYLAVQNGHVADISNKNGHMIGDGAGRFRRFDNHVNKAIVETKTDTQLLPDFSEHSKEIKPLSKEYAAFDHIETVSIEGDRYNRLITIQEKLYPLLLMRTTDEKKEGIKLDLATIVHFIAMATTGKETSQFLDIDKTTGTPATAIAVAPDRLMAALMSDEELSKTSQKELFTALRLLQFDRKAVHEGEGITKTFDSIAEGIKKILNALGKFADPAKKLILSKTGLMSSLLITKKPYQTPESATRKEEDTYFTITDFATAHYDEAKDLVVGGLHTPGKITVTFDYAIDETKAVQSQVRGYADKFPATVDKMLDKLEALYDRLSFHEALP